VSQPTLGGIPLERIAAVSASERDVYVQRHPRSRQRTGNGIAGFYDGVPMHWMRDWPMPFPFLVEEAHGATLRDVADRGAAVVMSTHLLGVAERMCDRILVMDKGKLVADRRGDELRALLAAGPTAIEDLYVSLIADEGPT